MHKNIFTAAQAKYKKQTKKQKKWKTIMYKKCI